MSSDSGGGKSGPGAGRAGGGSWLVQSAAAARAHAALEAAARAAGCRVEGDAILVETPEQMAALLGACPPRGERS